MSPTSVILSPQQERLWRLIQHYGDAAFRTRARLYVSGTSTSAIQTGLRVVFARHPVLRLRLYAHPTLQVPHPVELSDALALEEAAQLSCIDGDTCVVSLDLPAYCADEVSMTLIAQALSVQLEEDPAPVPEVAPFACVAEWERDLAQQDETATARGMWRERLTELRAACEAWPAVARWRPDFEPVRIRRHLPSAQRAWLDQWDSDASPSETGAGLLAAWTTVARRRLGVTLPVGVRLTGRGETDLDDVIGPMARVVPVAVVERPQRTFSAQVQATRAALFEAHARQEVFTWAMEREPAPAASAAAWIGFARQYVPPAGVRVIVAPESQCGIEDLFMYRLVDAGSELVLEYDAVQVDATQAAFMLDGLLAFIEAAGADSNQANGNLPVIGSIEQALLCESLRLSADTSTSFHEMFVAQVRTRPDAGAVVQADGATFSYSYVDRWAGALAQILTANGAAPERLIGICLRPSAALVVAMLATIKSGAAFVLLDPDQPAARLAQLSTRLGAAALICAEAPPQELQQACADVGTSVIDTLVEPADTFVVRQRTGAGLAYVVFTSGSTGEPRAVAITDGAFDSQIGWFVRHFALGPEARVLARTSPAFDAAIWELLAPLAAGATVVTAAGAGQHLMLAPVLKRGAITHVQLVPNLLARILADDPDCFRDLVAVFVGGEVLPARLACAVSAQGPSVINLYGPAECCIQVAAWRGDAGEHTGLLPVGLPAASCTLAVVDHRLTLAALGATGTLIIGGNCVARGYLGNPAATAAAFMPDPWSGAGRRVYLTGDVASRDSAGQFTVFGRSDKQVKIRGARVEPEEVAALLRSVPGVLDCAVFAEPLDAGGHSLVAVYVQASSAPAQFEGSLMREAAQRLPGFMVPARFVGVPVLPRLTSGKLDGAQLARMAGRLPYEAPVTSTERVLTDILGEILGVARVGRHDSFFDLGGHSILMLRVLSRLRTALGREIPMRFIYESRDVARLAHMIDALSGPIFQESINE